MLGQIRHYRLGAALRKALVVLGATLVVGVSGELDGDVGILVEQLHEVVERSLRLGAQRGLVEVVEDVVYEHRHADGGQRKLQGVFLRLIDGIDVELHAVVEIALAGGEHDVVDARIDDLLKGAVALDGEFQVGAVVADHEYLGGGQLVAVHLIDPSLDGLDHLGQLETIDMVPSAAVATVGGEEAPVVRALEGHAEVVAWELSG